MIVMKRVFKKYTRGPLALVNVSLLIEQGEFVYLMGESGSGKSTLLKTLYREEKVTKGYVEVCGQVVAKMKNREVPNLRRNIGIVFQDIKLLTNQTIFENIAYALRVIKCDERLIETRVLAVLREVGLEHKVNEYPGDCSGGEQQRVAIARALINNPSVILADEPTGNLDHETSVAIMRLFYRINQKGTTILMATHDSQLIEQIPYRVIELAKGKIKSDRSQSHVALLSNEKVKEYTTE
ncbi:cell division ATP-binding protein FtsE [Lacticigenium naphthae]|uniref:cell division ATP-binding protein FtsE n=1 Tax=Lacticigenium naphthae TaxID=515351 RepID=UPI0004165458|nr:cell division ATP-binding protein FtsE [Lacticigenium naphthae]